MSKKGIDVSKWQGVINWSKVAGAGIEFAIIRAGFGNAAAQKDPYFDQNYTNARAAGIPAGVYWYAYAKTVDEAVREADACLSVIKDKAFEYPIFYDMEEDKTQAPLGKAACTDIAIAFCQKIAEAGFKTGVYANKNWFTNYLDGSAIKNAGNYLWIAHYGTTTDYSKDYDMHQYTSMGNVDGVSGNVDMNYGFTGFIASDKQTEAPACPEGAILTTVHMRANAGVASSSVMQLAANTKVSVMGSENGWVKISYEGKEGYVKGDYISSAAAKAGTVTASKLNMREGPGTGYKVLKILDKGAKVEVFETGAWHKVRHSGTVGYVSAEYIKM